MKARLPTGLCLIIIGTEALRSIAEVGRPLARKNEFRFTPTPGAVGSEFQMRTNQMNPNKSAGHDPGANSRYLRYVRNVAMAMSR